MALVAEQQPKHHVHAMELVDRLWGLWISTSFDDYELKRILIDDLLSKEPIKKLENMIFLLEQKRKKLERDLIITKALKTIVADSLEISLDVGTEQTD